MALTLKQRWQRFARRKVYNYPREIPPRMVIKGAGIIMLGPILLLVILVMYRHLTLETAFWSLLFLFCISLIFILPYIANLSSLTNYVRALAVDKYAEAPDLSFLNNVEQLQEAVQELHETWQRRGRLMEQTLEESRILIDSLPDIIILLDEKGEILNTNTTAKSVFGSLYYRDHLRRIIDDAPIVNAVQTVLESGVGEDIAYAITEPFARHYVVRAEPFPPYSPSNIALIIVMHDITQQKLTEQMLADFVANASHEIRTPLTSVIGYIETLQTSAKDDPEVWGRFLGIMRDQTDRITVLVEDLLSLSQIERTIGTMPHDIVNITSLLKSVERYAEASARKKQIGLELSFSHKRPPRIIGDTGQLKRVFENLIHNAIKYSPAKSTIHIKAEIISNNAAYDMPDKYEKLCVVHIIDEGEGIAEEHLPRLTERFYRVDNARSRKVGGSGLGLAIAKQIIDRHHGVLDIKSTLGEGSTFSVVLPVPSKAQKELAKLRHDEAA